MKITIKNLVTHETKEILENFLGKGGFQVTQDQSEVDLHFLQQDEVLESGTAEKPKLVCGPGVFNFLKSLQGINLENLIASHEMRVRPQLSNARMQEDIYLIEQLALIPNKNNNLEVAANANYQLIDYPVAFYLKDKNLFILNVANIENFKSWHLAKFVKIWLAETLLKNSEVNLNVGLLAYGAIGHEHNRAVSQVPGFSLKAVCDSNPVRIEVAKELTPTIEAFTDAEKLLDSDIDLVVISTPPNSHYSWAKKALEKNKHVVLEKPMSLTVAECDELIELANKKDKTLVVYQNRRWDHDFLTIQKLVNQEKIGEVFHVEIFVGGYGHPCNYWHSDEKVSGGAIFDWGSHFLDQALALFGKDISYISAVEHKRQWLDVTNSDHSRITLMYNNGLEVEFIYSDLAAALKPKYYLLGTKGAIVGNWRVEKITARNEIGTLLEDRLAPADSPAEIEIFDEFGSITKVTLENPPKYQFHTELADWLSSGIPMTVNSQTSRDVVAVMQAASNSAAGGGLPVKPLL
jgi:scyllo-inositol 2-dehydrogenase (NADP+)